MTAYGNAALKWRRAGGSNMRNRSGWAHVADQAFHLTVEAYPQIGIDSRVVANRLGELVVRRGMEQPPHWPRLLRMRARDSSTGMPRTLPVSISAMRRSISVFQAASIPGSIPPCRASR